MRHASAPNCQYVAEGRRAEAGRYAKAAQAILDALDEDDHRYVSCGRDAVDQKFERDFEGLYGASNHGRHDDARPPSTSWSKPRRGAR